ncbi:MAG: AraC family transcriptional regulator [Clostridiales bacterium]|nr:AraC family transcriptional regulator [Clostridiales bacterium]
MINVMLIDGETLFQRAFAEMIGGMKQCRFVGVAENGCDAMNLLNVYHPQIIFVDAFLGEESGIDLCRRIKDRFPKSVIYILSNYCNFSLIQSAMKAGIEEYLFKPLSRAKLSSLITPFENIEKPEANDEEEMLFAAIRDKDYRRALHMADKMAGILFKEDDVDRRREQMETLASNMFYLVPGMDISQKNYYLQKYELSNQTLNRRILSCNWLMQVITEVFRQNCVMKYVHMNQVYQYIENNKTREISLTELSEQAGISGGYLSRIFKKYYNISVVDYIHLRKIHLAKYYMASSEMNISDISFLLGYSEAGYFCKIFKKYEGMTPSTFCNQYIKQEKCR